DVYTRNLICATPSLLGFRRPVWVDWKMKPQRPEKNGYMWYASPPEPCWTAIPTGEPVLRLIFRAWLSRSAQFFGTWASLRLTTSPMFSSCVGIPYRRAPFLPYEYAFSAYFGN